MQKYRGLYFIAAMLVFLSAAIYALHYTIFHDAHHILIYLVGDLAFLPLEVLLVGIVVERIMTKREVDEKISKLKQVEEVVDQASAPPPEVELIQELLEAAGSDRELFNKLNEHKKEITPQFREGNFAGVLFGLDLLRPVPMV